MKKAAPSPAKRQRKGSLSHKSSSLPPPASSSVGLAGAGAWGMNQPYYHHDQLGRARSDWELPDIGSASINAVSTWEEAAGEWDKADGGSGGAAASSSSNKNRGEKFGSSNMKMTQQFSHQQQPMLPPRMPNNRQQQPQQTHQSFGMSSTATVVTNSSMSSKSTKSSLSGMSTGSSLSSQPSIYSMSGSATVVTNSTMGSKSSGKSSVSSISTGSSLSSQPSIYSFTSGRTPATGAQVQPPPPVQPAAAQQQPPTAGAVVAATVPKASLYQFYGKKPRRKQLSNEDYFAWNNGGRPHELKFTAIFQCPVTGECFASGRYGDPKYFETTTSRNQQGQVVEIVWYTKKAFAEHGAAARCYDCLHYREALQQGNEAVSALVPMSSELPYTQAQAPHLPLMPNLVAEKIRTNQQRIQQVMPR